MTAAYSGGSTTSSSSGTNQLQVSGSVTLTPIVPPTILAGTAFTVEVDYLVPGVNLMTAQAGVRILDKDSGAAFCDFFFVSLAGNGFQCDVTEPTAGAHTLTIEMYSESWSADPKHIDEVTVPITVSKPPVTVSVSGRDAYQGTPTFTYTSDAPAGVTLTGTLVCTSVSGLPLPQIAVVGQFTVDGSSCSGLSASDGSTIDYVGVSDGFLLVKGDQQITFTAPTNGVTGTSTQLTATGGISLFPVTFSIDPASGPGVCSLSNATAVFAAASVTVSFGAPGACIVDANEPGSSLVNPAPQVSRTITVLKAAQQILFTRPAGGVAGTTTQLTATGGGSGNPVTFTVDSTSDAGVGSVAGTTVSFTATGTCIVDANQVGNANYSAAPQVSRTIAVAAPPVFVTAAPPSQAVVNQPYSSKDRCIGRARSGGLDQCRPRAAEQPGSGGDRRPEMTSGDPFTASAWWAVSPRPGVAPRASTAG